MEPHSDFHPTFLLQERRAILQRWVADQVTGTPSTPCFTYEPLPLVGYSSEFLDRFLDDLAEGRGDRTRDWLRERISESILDEITPSSLSAFLISLRWAITSLWSLENRYGPKHGPKGAEDAPGEASELSELMQTLSALDIVLLDGMALLERRRATDPSLDFDSLEFLKERRDPELDSIDCLDSVEITAPVRPAGQGLRNMAGLLRNFLSRDTTSGDREGAAAVADDPSLEMEVGQQVQALSQNDGEEEVSSELELPGPISVTGPGGRRLFDPTRPDLLALLSHEIRAPLLAILSVCEVREDDDGRQALPQADALVHVDRAARHLLHLADNLLDFHHFDARADDRRTEKPCNFLPCSSSVLQVAEDLVMVFTPLARRKGLALSTDVPADLAVAVHDLDQLVAVLRNLLANAIRFSESGTIRLEGALENDGDRGQRVRLTVRDEGRGISPDFLPHIFTPFWRGEPARGESRGTGLGLSVVREAVDALEGEITVESQPGKGSVFTVRIPATAS